MLDGFCAFFSFTVESTEDNLAAVGVVDYARSIDLRRSLFDDTIAFSRGLGEFKPSMLQDLEARKPLEYEAFNGIVIRVLRQGGQTAPVNQTFYALLQHLDRKSREEAAP